MQATRAFRISKLSGALLVGLVAVASTTFPALGASRDDPSQHWVGTWAASPHVANPATAAFGLPPPSVSNQTVRSIVYPHFGGSQVRVRLTNAFGAEPLTIAQADVALQATGAAIVPGSDRPLTFGGRTTVSIPVGAEVYSDPVALDVHATHNLVVSVYVPGSPTRLTGHVFATQTNFISVPGNHASEQGGSAFVQTTTSWWWLDGVDVTGSPNERAIVTLGDSITDGAASTLDANNRWPDFLARRLITRPPNQRSVLNEGIGGNRVLNDSPCFGPNALARLDRDVLAQDMARYVILLEGINDIGFSAVNLDATAPELRPCFLPNTDVSADQIIAGYQQIITRVHFKGLKILGGTLTPFKGANYYSAAGEAKRQAVNQWIRTSGEFDGVIDFDAATRDPADPLMFLPAYDSGDHLHPSDAGYEAMGNTINLSLFAP